MNHENFMRRAMGLAEGFRGRTAPNPLVGAILVDDDTGDILGIGTHEAYGEPHAERMCLQHTEEDLSHATMYVTLEPCTHWGKQPPCTDLILEKHLGRVIIGARDPNPKAKGGAELLRSQGVHVEVGVLEEEIRQQNDAFFTAQEKHRPLITLKYAMSLDGRICREEGRPFPITGAEANAHVQRMRHEHRGILVGVGTVLADDPLLSCRHVGGRQPLRIVCDTHLRTPLASRLVTTARELPTLIATSVSEKERILPYKEAGIEVLTLERMKDHIALAPLMSALLEREIDSVLVEGGAHIHGAFAGENLVDHVLAYMAPKFLGQGLPPVMGEFPPKELFEAQGFSEVIPLGDDVLLHIGLDDEKRRFSHVYGHR